MKAFTLADFPPSAFGPTTADGLAKLSRPTKAKPKRSKYGNKKVTTPDGTFDSNREYARWQVLVTLEKAGKINGLRRQVPFPLTGPNRDVVVCKYVADFTYYESGRWIVEDVKGHKTAMYRLKKKWMKSQHDIEILETA